MLSRNAIQTVIRQYFLIYMTEKSRQNTSNLSARPPTVRVKLAQKFALRRSQSGPRALRSPWSIISGKQRSVVPSLVGSAQHILGGYSHTRQSPVSTQPTCIKQRRVPRLCVSSAC